jgi:hypothetical protein
MRCSLHVFIPPFCFSLVCFGFHRSTAGNPARYNAEILELLESGFWFTSDTCRQERADVTDEITAKGEVR